ncbi:nitrous oxide reductase family maturation protein NosD [Melioribacter sp. Ez-97]|uniref:nitrous oxide reductase family maturation protein NosD n=1 Tax=Melioribacter sp. Ez-97 TaxID=3423434 RepID=UPI003ED85B0F
MNGFNIIILLLIVLASLGQSSGKVLTVGSNEKFKKISDALKYANNYDTVVVTKGVYKEGSITIDKKITLLGKDYPVLSGEDQYEIMKISASGVIVRNLEFRNAGVSFIHDNAALRLDSVSNCVIENNRFTDNFFAVYLARSSNCKIINNVIVSSNKSQTHSANGIHLWYCKDIVIENNFIQGHRDGIYFEFVRNSRVVNNISKNNLRYGLHFMFSDSCLYAKNKFMNNRAGVAVMFTRSVTMEKNEFVDNWGAASYGLLLKEIYDSEIKYNKFIGNTCGVYYESCARVKATKNLFSKNGWAIKLMANSMDNSFVSNNFVNNTFDVSTNSVRNYNHFESNYWSKYEGYDLNKDGYGDVPYRPVNLFSYIVVKNPTTLILLHSLFVKLLDLSEKIFPALTPAELQDKTPRMKKYYDID